MNGRLVIRRRWDGRRCIIIRCERSPGPNVGNLLLPLLVPSQQDLRHPLFKLPTDLLIISSTASHHCSITSESSLSIHGTFPRCSQVYPFLSVCLGQSEFSNYCLTCMCFCLQWHALSPWNDGEKVEACASLLEGAVWCAVLGLIPWAMHKPVYGLHPSFNHIFFQHYVMPCCWGASLDI